MKKLALAALAVLAVFCLAGCSWNWGFGGLFSGFDYADGNKYKTGAFEYNAADVDAVVVNWVSGSVTLTQKDGNGLKVSEEESGLSQAQKMRWRMDGRTLRIQFCESGYVGVISREKKLTVEIPSGIDLRVAVTSGNVLLDEHDLKKVEFDATSGDISMKALRADSLDAAQTSGSISLGDLRVKDDLKVTSTSGSIYGDSVKAKNARITGTSGSVKITALEAEEEVKIVSTSGGASLKTLTAKKADIGSTSGSHSVEEANVEELKMGTTSGTVTAGLKQVKSADFGSTSGAVRLTLLSGLGATVRFDTASGDMNGKGGDDTVIFGDGSCRIRVGTTSGDLTVK